MQHTNTSSMSGDSTTSLFCRDLGARWLTTRSEGHSNGWAKDCPGSQVAKFGEPVALGVCRFRDGSGICSATIGNWPRRQNEAVGNTGRALAILTRAVNL